MLKRLLPILASSPGSISTSLSLKLFGDSLVTVTVVKEAGVNEEGRCSSSLFVRTLRCQRLIVTSLRFTA